jgi:hypothetical protein
LARPGTDAFAMNAIPQKAEPDLSVPDLPDPDLAGCDSAAFNFKPDPELNRSARSMQCP